MPFIRWIIVTVVILTVMAFALQNQSQTVTITFGTYTSTPIPLFMALFGAFVVGILIYFVMTLTAQLKLRGDVSRYRRECVRLKDELNRLRNLNLDKELEMAFRSRSAMPMVTVTESRSGRSSDEYEGFGA
ncbi:MAG: LapA family protein [bacterium]|nr:LapA family protein [bacterium]